MQIAKKKAIELVDKFSDYVNCWNDNGDADYKQALDYGKKCALIVVNECISVLYTSGAANDVFLYVERLHYWNKVKEEIENLQ